MGVTDWRGHQLRYRLAAGYIKPTDVVLDAACRNGYGAALAPHAAQWIGVDIEPCVEPEYAPLGQWITADLCNWGPDQRIDVALSFETIEHVAEPEKMIDMLCNATRLVMCSVPIVPTAGANPEHLHDFTLFDLPRLFSDRGWGLHQFLIQPSELSGIYIFEP